MTRSVQPPPLKRQPKAISKMLLVPMIVLGIGGLLYAFTSLDDHMKTEQDGLALLHALQGSDIVKVVVSEELSPPRLMGTITNAAALTSFANAANQAERYSPNHPSYAQDFYVEVYLRDGQRLEYQFHTKRPPDNVIYIWFVHKKGAWTSYHGNAQSRSLFTWMGDHQLTKLPQQGN